MSYTLKNIKNYPIKDRTTVKVTSDFGKRKLYNKILNNMKVTFILV